MDFGDSMQFNQHDHRSKQEQRRKTVDLELAAKQHADIERAAEKAAADTLAQLRINLLDNGPGATGLSNAVTKSGYPSYQHQQLEHASKLSQRTSQSLDEEMGRFGDDLQADKLAIRDDIDRDLAANGVFVKRSSSKHGRYVIHPDSWINVVWTVYIVLVTITTAISTPIDLVSVCVCLQ